MRKHQPKLRHERPDPKGEKTQALTPSADLYSALVEDAGDAFIVHDPEGRLVYANRRATHMLGYTLDELLAKTLEDIDPGLYRPHADGLWEKVVKEGRTTFESRLAPKSGNAIPVEVTLTALALAGTRLFLGIIRDLTWRDDQERTYGQLIESMNDVAVVVATSGKFCEVNSRATEMLGYSRNELLSMGPTDVDVGTDPSVISEQLAQVGSGERLVVETVHRAKDGTHRPVEIALSPTFYQGQKAILGVIRDIAARKEAEALLLASDALNRTMFDSNPDPVIISEPNGRFLDCNQTAVRTYGYSREELLQMTYRDLAALELRDKAGAHVADTLAHGGAVFEWRHRRKDGSELPVEIRTVPFVTQGEQRIMATIRDLTSSKAAEEALRRSEREFRALFEAAPMGIGVADLQGNFLAFNDAILEPGGYDRDDIAHLGNVSALYYDGAARDTALALFLAQGSLRQHETQFRRKDGTPYEVWLSLTHTTFNGVSGVQAIVEDRTEELEAQEAQERLKAQLSQAAKMESIGRLAGGVAHDFNNMLAVILGHVELALERTPPENGLYGDLQEIRSAAQHSAAITQQLLAFARRQVALPRILDLNRAVEDMLGILRKLAGENVELVWLPARNLAKVRIDPAQLDQILVNLCLNARDALEKNGRVTISTSDITVDDKCFQEDEDCPPGDYVRLSVADTGIGMTSEALEHLFEPFFTTKQPGKGTGLGLATVYGIVEQNHGCIHVQSTREAGTAVHVYLPRVDATVTEDGLEALPHHSQAGGPQTLLVVEDEPSVLRLTKRILGELGYKVLTAANPREALRVARKNIAEIDMVITDVVMPEMNGWDLAARLRSLLPGLRTLYTSGYAEEMLPGGAAAKEGVDFLQKPYAPGELAAAVRAVLDRE